MAYDPTKLSQIQKTIRKAMQQAQAVMNTLNKMDPNTQLPSSITQYTPAIQSATKTIRNWSKNIERTTGVKAPSPQEALRQYYAQQAGQSGQEVVNNEKGWAFTDSPGVNMPASMVRNYLTPDQYKQLTEKEKDQIMASEQQYDLLSDLQEQAMQGNPDALAQLEALQRRQRNEQLYQQGMQAMPGFPGTQQEQQNAQGLGTQYGNMLLAGGSGAFSGTGAQLGSTGSLGALGNIGAQSLQEEINNFPLANLNIQDNGSELAPDIIDKSGGATAKQLQAQYLYLTKKVLNETMLFNDDEILDAKAKVVKAQNKIDKITETIENIREDIKKETKGRAPQSYIDAKVVARTNELMKLKREAEREYRLAVTELDALTEARKQKLQYYKETRQAIKDQLQMILNNQWKANNYKLDLVKTIATLRKSLLPGEKMEVGGYIITGVGDASDYQLFKVTSPSGAVHIVRVNKATGQMERYATGLTEKVSGSSGSSSGVKVLKALEPDEAKEVTTRDWLEKAADNLGYSGWFDDGIDTMLKDSQILLAQNELGQKIIVIKPYAEISKGKKGKQFVAPVTVTSKK